MFEVRMGLPKQEVLYNDFNAMREAIQLGARDSGLIHNCLVSAQRAGLSGEDTYVLLAFHALQMLEDFWQKNLQTAYLSPTPPIVISDVPAKTTG